MSKYRNIKTVVDGVTFDSKAEARRFQELKLLERAGEISRLERQVKYKFEHNGVKLGSYIADFAYFTKTERVVEDVKSPATAKLPMFRLKAKMMKAFYGIEVKIVQ